MEWTTIRPQEAVEITVFTALHNAGVAYEDFSPEQIDVIYSVAESGGELEELLNPDFPPEQMQLIADVQNRTDAISRAAAEEALEPLTQQPMTPAEVNHARRQHNLPLDSEAETEQPAQPKQKPINFRITDDDLGAGGPKTKYKANVEAIRVLQTLDAEQRQATAEEQEILSRYVGWGGIPQAFDENNADWSKEYAELESLLTADEYKEARASTLNAFYTSPTVIKAMYEALDNMGLSKGNVLEPSCGVGNFMGLVPDSMEKIRMYGVELDSISGRIAQQLYQKNKIAVQGFETMQFPDSFFVGQTQCTSEVFQVSDIENAVLQALKKELSLLDSLYGDIQKEEQGLKEAHKKANFAEKLENEDAEIQTEAIWFTETGVGLRTWMKSKNNHRRVKKPGVNALCPCGSGKKFKKCCRGNGRYD